MQDQHILIVVSAFSGLAGALLTQLITTFNGYLVDKRKARLEVSASYRNKRIEIGENFYFVHGEIMSVIKKNITFWQNWNNGRSAASLEALSKEVSQFTAYMEKLYAENWKYNLISLYFPITFAATEVIESNAISKKYQLSVLDVTAAIKNATPDDQDALYKKYALIIFDMCSHYERLYDKMEQDRAIVKAELLADFSASDVKK
jgi:Mor family transcriptional regulator